MIKLYTAEISCLKNPDIFNNKYYSLPELRREKIDKFKFESDKQLSLAAGLILKHALSVENIDISTSSFYNGKYGKPYLADRSDIYFSLSHSKERVLCAVSDKELGCDIQYTEENALSKNLNIAKRFFTKNEYSVLLNTSRSNSDESLSNDLFYRIWALKESVIKACGQGLSLPLDSFESLPSTEYVILSDSKSIKTKYYLKSYDFLSDYKCSIAALSKDFPDKPTEYDLSL